MIQYVHEWANPKTPASCVGLVAFYFLRLGKRACHAPKTKSPASTSLKRGLCARDWIRTSTPFPAPPPQGGASTNFATRADLQRRKRVRAPYTFSSSCFSAFHWGCKCIYFIKTIVCVYRVGGISLTQATFSYCCFINTILKVVPFPGSELLTVRLPL